ncbi:MAG: dTDP-4-dehydrorhamnose 3,5-epimerase [Bacilli bacterium]
MKEELEKNGLGNIFSNIVQTNRSLSAKGIVRGLHFQKDPKCQAKIVECLQGAVLDVVVDIRNDSKTYGKWTSVLLTPEKGNQLLVPKGFAHGFVSLKDNTLFQYLVDNEYSKELEGGILWNDPDLNIDWQFEKYNITNPILSEKDQNHLPLKESNLTFKRGDN